MPCRGRSFLWVQRPALGGPSESRPHAHLCVHSEPQSKAVRLDPTSTLIPWVPWPLLWCICSYPQAFCIGIQALASLFPVPCLLTINYLIYIH